MKDARFRIQGLGDFSVLAVGSKYGVFHRAYVGIIFPYSPPSPRKAQQRADIIFESLLKRENPNPRAQTPELVMKPAPTRTLLVPLVGDIWSLIVGT